jgi:DNA polymerase III alpha subunit
MIWNMPEEYQSLDIRKYILDRHSLTDQEINRVDHELNEFINRNLIDLLRFLVYLVSMLRSNNIVYGVGRGSSIASYVLYLIGIHRINSFKFNLDIKEFLK